MSFLQIYILERNFFLIIFYWWDKDGYSVNRLPTSHTPIIIYKQRMKLPTSLKFSKQPNDFAKQPNDFLKKLTSLKNVAYKPLLIDDNGCT